MAAFMQSLGPSVDAAAVNSMVSAAEAAWAASGNDVPGDAADGSPAAQLLAAVLGKTQDSSMSQVARQRAHTVAQALAALATALSAAAPPAALAAVTAAAAPAAAAARLQLQVESLKSDVASLRERLGAAEEEGRVAARTLLRAQLDYPHVAFADSPMPLGEQTKAKAAAAAAATAQAAAAAAAPAAASGTGTGAADSVALAEAREAAEEAAAEAETYKSIMQKQKETLGKLNATVKSLSDNLAAHTAQPVKASDVAAHPVHVEALSQLAIVVRQRDLLKAELDQCSADLKALRLAAAAPVSGGGGALAVAQAAFAEEAARLGEELRKAKAEAATAAQREAVAQVRAQRVVELESTVTEQSRALEALSADAARWRTEWKARAGTENTKVKEFVDVLAAKVEKLSRVVGERDGAIDALKAAERSAVREGAVLAALQAAAAAGGDASAAGDTIARLRTECGELQEKLSAARAEAVAHRSEREKVAVQYTALQAQLLSALAEREATEEALDEVSEAYEASQAAAADALGKLASKDGVLGGMASSLSDAKGTLAALGAKASALEAQQAEHKQAAADAEALQGALRQELQRAKEALSKSVAEYSALRCSQVLQWATLPHGDVAGSAERLLHSASNAQRDALQGRVDGLLKQVAASGAREAAANAEAEDATAAAEAANSKVAMLTKRVGDGVAAGSGGGGGGVGKDTRRELRDLREMVFCPVVKTKLKSAVLKQCGHGMCKEALEQRLKDRLRRCPVCNKGFSADDVVELHLGSM